VLAPDARRNVALFSLAENQPSKPKFRFEKRKFEGKTEESDVLIIEDLPVFRSGTFRDSMGYQHTWESIHMSQMVAHFDLLRSRGILLDVPTRRGHPSFLTNSLDEVIGYHTGLRVETRTSPVDGEDYEYLLATFEVMDPDAITKISSGLWRNVSAEVGGFLSNNETEFWPVYQGVAYVDIPAVEGLRSFNNHNGVGKTFSLMLDTDKEAPVAGENDKNGTGSGTPAPQVDVAYHTRASFTFSIGGKQTNDFAAVQAHITSIEAQNSTLVAAQAEAKTANRKAFIKGLAEGPTPKILAAQIPHIEGYALNMDDDSWTAFQKAHEDAPALASVSEHGNPGGAQNPGGTTPVGQQAPAGPSELETQLEIFLHNKRTGLPAEKLKQLGSYSKLKSATTTDENLQSRISAALQGIPA
jgi:hypothetical protein